MPHVDIKCYPRELSEAQKQAIADDIAQTLMRHLPGSTERTISVALNMVQPEEWKSQVWDKEIAPQLDSLIKKPGYSE